jgi:polyhydroxybutyrate depolymerase
VEVRLCVTDSGGHAWPGGRKALGGKGSDALDATAEIWHFFARQ